jgi:hypothetical protein
MCYHHSAVRASYAHQRLTSLFQSWPESEGGWTSAQACGLIALTMKSRPRCRRRESPLRKGKQSPSKKSPPRPRPAPTEQEDSNEEAAMPAATADETDSGDIAADGENGSIGDGDGAGEAKRPRSWGKFPPQGGVDPGGLILADGGVYEHRVARRKEWEDADDGSDSEDDREGPRPEEIAAQSVEECVALYERTTLSVKNKHWVPSRSSDILHAKLHAEWDAVDSAIRDVQVNAANTRISRPKNG